MFYLVLCHFHWEVHRRVKQDVSSGGLKQNMIIWGWCSDLSRRGEISSPVLLYLHTRFCYWRHIAIVKFIPLVIIHVPTICCVVTTLHWSIMVWDTIQLILGRFTWSQNKFRQIHAGNGKMNICLTLFKPRAIIISEMYVIACTVNICQLWITYHLISALITV